MEKTLILEKIGGRRRRWSPDPKSQVMGKDPELGKREGKRRRKSQRMEMVS